MMTEIKSALEIALERTQGVTGDREKLEADEVIKEGKRIASSFLSISESVTESDIRTKLATYSGKKLGWVREGIFQTLLANVVLPFDETYREKLEVVGRGMPEVVHDRKRTGSVFEQIGKFFQQYLDNKSGVRQQLEAQFAQRLRQREQQLAKQVGQAVRLDPMQDPEFVSALQRNYAQLDERYQEALDQLKGDLRKMFENA